MSRNLSSSTKTSFNPIDQYNRITEIMANKNNLKVKRKLIPGIDRTTQPRKPIQKFSKQYIQNKFIAKYANCEPKAKVQSNENSANRNGGLNSQVKSKLMPFQFRKPVEMPRNSKKENSKRQNFSDSIADADHNIFKKPAAPSAINKLMRNPFTQQNQNRFDAPPFKGTRSRVSLFEQPKVQTQRRQKSEFDQGGISVPPMNDSNNETLATITSAQFKPPESSTPVEADEKVGMFVDPDKFDLNVSTLKMKFIK